VSSRRALIVILCEDAQHQVFCWRYLRRIGVGHREIRALSGPAGEQSGVQYVREHYPVEVRAYRQMATRHSQGLMVMTDADDGSVDQRKRQLADALQTAGGVTRAQGENIALLVPKRSIETWIRYLGTDGQVDETIQYPKLPKPGDCQPAVEKFHVLCSSGNAFPPNCPSSLREACSEVNRLP
jgi:hypothetical protein